MLLVLLLGGQRLETPESQYWTACFRDENGRQRRISTKETNNKKALKIAEEFEGAAKTKRTLKQVQKVLDRLHEEVSGQSIKRTTFRKHLSEWLTAKKTEIASSTMDFYQASLRKFLHFLGQRADEPIGEITKEDVVAFRDSLVNQVTAKTVNHNLKTLKMLFKSARRDSAVTDDPTEFVETVRKERRVKIKRPFTLPELRSVLDLANNEWAINDSFWPLYRPAAWRHCKPAMEQSGSRSRRAAPFDSENRQDIGPAIGGASSETSGVFVTFVERTLCADPPKSCERRCKNPINSPAWGTG